MALVIFILGAIIGSFLNLCVDRIPRNESVILGRSHCSKCNTTLKIYELIPILSFIFLKGKCRSCKEKLSFRHILVESFTGIIFFMLYIKFGLSLEFFKYTVLAGALLCTSLIDYDKKEVYTITSTIPIVMGIIFLAMYYFQGYKISNYIYGAIFCGIIMYTIMFLTGAMGEGDVEIALLSGLYLGLNEAVLMILLSFIIGGTIGAILLITKKVSRKTAIPFVPYIAIASLITVFIGNSIINFYLQFILHIAAI